VKRILFAVLSLVLLIFTSGTAFAATATPVPGANGYNIYPLLTSDNIPAGTSKTVTITVQNASNSVEQVATIVNDFVAAPTDNGIPALLLNGGTSKYDLKQFISIPNGNFILSPRQSEAVNVVITIPANTDSGGYFGAVRFAPASLVTTKKHVNLSGGVASLIFVTVPGNLKQNLGITKMGVENSAGQMHMIFLSNKNLSGIVYFQNYGNVQVQPLGNFIVKSGKKEIDIKAINGANGLVLPASARYFTAKLHHIGSFGKFTLYGNFGYGTRGQLLYATSTFYLVPIWLLFAVPIVVLVLIALIVYRINRRRKSTPRYRQRY
jgi:hypothetical protein